MHAIDSVRRESVLKQADFLVRKLYDRLPVDYFSEKNARTYLFNNIIPLIDRIPTTDASRVSSKVAIQTEMETGELATLYVGVPWCEQICSFCNFAYTTNNQEAYQKDYVNHLLQELTLLKDLGLSSKTLTSVYFGGGTPTATNDNVFSYYLKTVLSSVKLSQNASITCEGTVGSFTQKKIELMRACGVNRVSTGLQSLDDQVRSRAHLRLSGAEALERVSRVCSEFPMFNIDLIYGHPYQSAEAWYDTVVRTAAIQPASLTLYRLEVKPRTHDFKKYQLASDASEEIEARKHYFIAKNILEEGGYIESPLGWWIRADKLRSNQSWQQHMSGWSKAAPYFGIGQGAFSLLRGLYYENDTSGRNWSASIGDERLPIKKYIPLPSQVAFANQLFRSLRTAQTFRFEELRGEFEALGLWQGLSRIAEQQVNWGLAELQDGEFRLTDAGRSLIHWTLSDLVDAFSSAINI